MMQRPDDEKYLVTQSELENKICVLLGGITAEQITFQETSTGAQNDLQRATDTARRMVMEFGMSPKLGRVHYSESKRSPFLGTESGQSDASHSEDTIREIDLEVKRIIDESSAITLEILQTRKEVLEHMTRELTECEVMDAEQLKVILDQHKTGPQIKHGTSAATTPTTETDSPEATSEENSPPNESADGV